jgi:hypothetical protein
VSIQHFPVQFQGNQPLVDQNGIPLPKTGRPFFLGLYNRTGQANGIVPSVTPPPGVTATGVSIADAFQLSQDWNDIDAGGANTGVAIAAALNEQPGNDIWVFNGTGTNKNVYPPAATAQIDALGAGNPFVLAAGKLRCFQCWYAITAGITAQFRSYGN